jgi:putative ABC transport system permease protein
LSLSTEARARDQYVPFLRDDQLIVIGVSPGARSTGVPDDVLDRIEAALPGAVVGREMVAMPAETRSGETVELKQDFIHVASEPGTADIFFVATPEFLRANGVDDPAAFTALRDGKVVAIGAGSTDDGVVHLVTFGEQATVTRSFDAVEVARPIPHTMFQHNYFVSPERAVELGFTVVTTDLALVRAATPLTDEQIDGVRAIVDVLDGGYVEAESGPQINLGIRRWTLAGFAVFAMAVVGVAVALVGAESRRDQAILTAVGAEPRIRRRLMAANAGLLALVAGALAVPAGFVPVVVAQIAQAEDYPIVVPWTSIGVVLVGVPLLVAGAAMLVTRPAATARLLQAV